VLLPLLWTYRRGTGRPALDFVLAWLATTFVVLSLNVNKQIQYALLLAPPLAILLGVRLAAGLPYAHRWRLVGRGFAALLVVACAWLAVRLCNGWLAAVPLAAAALIGMTVRGRAPAGTVLLAVAMIAAFRLGEAYGLRRHHDTASQQRAAGLAARGLAPLATLHIDEPVLAFYAHEVPLRLDPAALAARVRQAGTVYLIAPGEQIERLELPGNLVAEPLLTQPRISLWRVHQP
jgi:4-amino-4-deoxy-L-arabinose transferase-like glycosyltransferase